MFRVVLLSAFIAGTAVMAQPPAPPQPPSCFDWRIGYVTVDDKGTMQIRVVQPAISVSKDVTIHVEVETNGQKAYEKKVMKVQHSFATAVLIHVDSKHVKVLDLDQKPVDDGKLTAIFRREQAVVVTDQGRMLEPSRLPLLKKGTYIVVFPSSLDAVPVPQPVAPKKIMPKTARL